MKIIDIYNKVANGEEVPNFIIDEIEYYVGTDGFLKSVMGDEVEWVIYKEWLNEEVKILEEVEDKEEVKNDDGFTGVMGYCNGVEMFSINYTGDMEAYKKCLKKARKNIDKIIEDKEYKDIQKIKNKRFTRNQKQIASKINELIDVVNEIRKKEDK